MFDLLHGATIRVNSKAIEQERNANFLDSLPLTVSPQVLGSQSGDTSLICRPKPNYCDLHHSLL
jgi:hypothetical protein